jgi:VWFA-related protein
MKRIVALMLLVAMALCAVAAQTPTSPQKPQQEAAPEDVIRITTSLVQTDVVVTDKNDQAINDLKLEDFELFDNGKKQDIKFMEFVSVDTGRRAEGNRANVPAGVEIEPVPGLTKKEVRRVVAFVVDDLTIPDADLPFVRGLLLDFVDNKMHEGDLVAIVRTIGGKGLLQQFTSDRQLLRRAIATMNVITSPFKTTNNPDPTGFTVSPRPLSTEGGGSKESVDLSETGTEDISGPNDDTNRLFRGLTALTTANFIIDSLKEIPGHKNLVIVSGGIPIFEATSSGTAFSNVSYLLNRLSDNAIRAGVTINALDPRGLKATPGVVGFDATPARSGLEAGGIDPTFGRGGQQNQAVFGELLAGGSEHLGLSSVTDMTGGISVINTNNFKEGLDRILNRSRSYYTLAYTPSEKFDNKFHKIEIKVRRSDVRVHTQSGYVAREDRAANIPRTKEEEVAAAARSPLTKRDIDLAPNVAFKLLPNSKAELDIFMRIDAGKLHFTQSPEGKYQTSFDVVGFVFDQLGKLRGGFSETISPNLTADNYKRALNEGLIYSASTEVPAGYYQVRAVVREAGTSSLGTFSKYLEIPNLANGQLAVSSLFLFGIDPANPKPIPQQAVRQFSQKQDLRYAALIYNAKLKDGKPQLRSQLIISQGSNVVLRGSEEPVEVSNPSQMAKIGQIGLSKVKPGRYILTLIVTDPLADKKSNTLSRSIDFIITD